MRGGEEGKGKGAPAAKRGIQNNLPGRVGEKGKEKVAKKLKWKATEALKP